MKAMILLSKAMATILVFSFHCVLLAQLPTEPPPSGLPGFQPPPRRALADYIPSIPEFAKLLVQPNYQDDPIKRLQREQLTEAFRCVDISRAIFATGQSESFSDLLKYQKLAASSAFELAETKEKKIECLEFVVEATKQIERIVVAKSEALGSSWLSASNAKYWRLEAEINLLKFKRDSVLVHDPNRLDK